jgi:hypothetical protein
MDVVWCLKPTSSKLYHGLGHQSYLSLSENSLCSRGHSIHILCLRKQRQNQDSGATFSRKHYSSKGLSLVTVVFPDIVLILILYDLWRVWWTPAFFEGKRRGHWAVALCLTEEFSGGGAVYQDLFLWRRLIEGHTEQTNKKVTDMNVLSATLSLKTKAILENTKILWQRLLFLE